MGDFRFFFVFSSFFFYFFFFYFHYTMKLSFTIDGTDIFQLDLADDLEVLFLASFSTFFDG